MLTKITSFINAERLSSYFNLLSREMILISFAMRSHSVPNAMSIMQLFIVIALIRTFFILVKAKIYSNKSTLEHQTSIYWLCFILPSKILSCQGKYGNQNGETVEASMTLISALLIFFLLFLLRYLFYL